MKMDIDVLLCDKMVKQLLDVVHDCVPLLIIQAEQIRRTLFTLTKTN